ncbi:MAG TPA: polysaccharide deacetylase family protein [Planctomycetaceae bacterium]|nr:polysaccharide deacetylase family protein [Planctomycetaceae bacterium]HQZ63889.1 polysaccharide deacetylase family protein [Planctomycetaceae bacterium]HRA88757.1 polysaccharide deacetylase family protein [Planctomycetaceae bacterium]
MTCAADEPSANLAILKPIPDRLVVLTFDDSAKSHYTVARPLLKEYGFGATFFVTEGFDFKDNKKDYMTWEEIRELHQDGFEIGNHTRDHLGITEATFDRLSEQLDGIAMQCEAHGIPAHALDRLGRSLPHLVKIIGTLTERNITLISYREDIASAQVLAA